jgi:type I restriction enzyme S subunit
MQSERPSGKDGFFVQVKPGYKQTALGMIPVDWEVSLLDSVATRGSGHTPDKSHSEYWDGQIKWISLQDSDRLDQLYIYDTAAKITPAGIANSSAKMHPEGTVVLSRDAGVGKSAIMKDDMAVSQHFIAWQCGSLLNNHFLYYWLQSNKSEFQRIAMGNTIKTIGLSYFRQLVIPRPTKAEQQAIAEALSDADALTGLLEQLIAKKLHLKQGTMQEMLTGNKRLPGFENTRGCKQTEAGVIPADWDSRPLSELGHWKGGATPSMRNPRYWLNGTVPWVSSGDVKSTLISNTPMKITESAVKESSATLLPPHSIMIVTRSGILRRYLPVAKNTCPLAINQDIKALMPNDKAIPNYLLQLLISNGPRILARCLKSGTTVESIEFPWLKAFQVPLPPTKAEQEGIAAVLNDMDAEISELKAKLAKARQIKQGMMQELLTGRTRLT